ncbi:MAG: hypothetical protein VX589_00460 [Myxococcota bacterium]|nr:hypothetical protein [Myxococcota bacterium]
MTLELHRLMAVSFRRVDLVLMSTLSAPVGCLIPAWLLSRSTHRTLKQGGVYWRTQFYRITALRKAVRIDL